MKWYWQAAIEGVLQKYLNMCSSKELYKVYSCICIRNLSKVPLKEFNFSKVTDMKPATLMKFWTPSQVFFWLVLAQLQNQFFVEQLPVAAYVRCLKEKERKKWNSVFLLYSVWHSSMPFQGLVGKIRTN